MAKVHVDGSNDSDFRITVSQKDDDKVLLSLIGKEFMDGIGEVFITVSDPKTFDVRVLLQNALNEANKVYEELNKPNEFVDASLFDDLRTHLNDLSEGASEYKERMEEAVDAFENAKEDAFQTFRDLTRYPKSEVQDVLSFLRGMTQTERTFGVHFTLRIGELIVELEELEEALENNTPRYVEEEPYLDDLEKTSNGMDEIMEKFKDIIQ